ncbi:MAG TPA: nucleoside monophosphate kinase [Phycisphaerales bacterium]|nr:nucleoside monophosphate kinase [Phycisphaerales bacterium]
MSTDRYQTILLFGPPGVGKGTQGKILHQVPGFFHSSTGDIFRNLDAQSELGKLFFQYSSRGELVPDDVTMRIWHQNVYAQSILQMFKPNADLLVLDGLPRSVNQANVLYRYCNVLAVVHLVCRDKEALFERMRKRALKQNRVDDAKPEVIRRRFEVYEAETKPVLDFYPSESIIEVDAMGSPAEVLMHILDEVVPLQKAHFDLQSSEAGD